MQTITWKARLGNLEGLLSLLCLLCVLTAPLVQPDLLSVFVAFSLGAGLGVGGYRYGTRLGKICGSISVCVFSLLLLEIMGARLWDYFSAS